MNPANGPRDPRRLLLLAVPGLLLVGLLGQALTGTDPLTGLRLNRALAALEAGQPGDALARLEPLVVSRPGRADVWLRAGQAMLALGRDDEAVTYLQRAAELDARSETIRFELARALTTAGDLVRAESAARETLALEPDHAGAHYLLASIAAVRGDVDAACGHLEVSLDLRPSWPERYRRDPAFDPVRNDRRFVEAVRSRRLPGAFAGAGP
jgi:cytochrome c-type biogenesis protein CcmH/NrfG